MKSVKSAKGPGCAAARLRKFIAVLTSALLLFSVFAVPAGAEDQSGQSVCFAELREGANGQALWRAIKCLCPEAEFLYEYKIALDGFSFRVNAASLPKLQSFEAAQFKVSRTYEAPVTADKSSAAIIGAAVKALENYRGEGMVIAVIDVGFNTRHEIFSLTDESKARLTRDIVDEAVARGLTISNFASYENVSPYVNAKIPFAYDYYKRTSRLMSSADHGNHVAAIAAGNAANATDPYASDGIAPEAQLLLMNVGDEKGNDLSDALVYAAMEDAIALGADVINISLGRAAGFGTSTPKDEGYAKLISRAYELGIDVVCSAGNEWMLGTGSNFDERYGISMPLASMPDYSLISDPGCFPYAISVAASVNEEYVVKDYIEASDGTKIIYNAPPNSDFAKRFGGKTIEYAVIPGLGDVSDFEGVDVSGKIALISRGTLTFAEKVKNAEKAGAVGAIIYDNVDSAELVTMAVDDGSIPSAFISRADGLLLANCEKQTVKVVAGEPATAKAPFAGGIASYSSWGVSSDLRLKPDITAPGSYIYSALYEGYGTLSGTSMSAPHVSGALAVLKQYIKTLDLAGLSEEERRALPRALLMSTAGPIWEDGDETYLSPRLQGAGVMNLAGAASAGAYAFSPDTLAAKIELGDRLGEEIEFTIAIKNISSRKLKYRLKATVATDEVKYIEYVEGADWFVTGKPRALKGASVKLAGGAGYELNIATGKARAELVTLPSGGTAELTLKVKLDEEEKAELDKIFPSGWYLDGFVMLEAVGGGANLVIPYMGFIGDWSAISVFDLSGEFYSDILCTGVMANMFSISTLGTNPVTGDGEPSSERFILSFNGDDAFDFLGLKLNLLRNCRDAKYEIKNSAGEIVAEGKLGNLQKAYYNSELAKLQSSYYNIVWDGAAEDNARYVYPDGEYTITIEVTTDGGAKHLREFKLLSDTVKPKLDSYRFVEKDGRVYLVFTASDNTYLASICVYESAAVKGQKPAYIEARAYDANVDSSKVTEEFDVTECVEGNEWLYIEIVDYAFNINTYRIPTAGYRG